MCITQVACALTWSHVTKDNINSAWLGTAACSRLTMNPTEQIREEHRA